MFAAEIIKSFKRERKREKKYAIGLTEFFMTIIYAAAN